MKIRIDRDMLLTCGSISAMFMLFIYLIYASVIYKQYIDEHCIITDKSRFSVTYVKAGDIRIPIEKELFLYNCDDGENRWK